MKSQMAAMSQGGEEAEMLRDQVDESALTALTALTTDILREQVARTSPHLPLPSPRDLSAHLSTRLSTRRATSTPRGQTH